MYLQLVIVLYFALFVTVTNVESVPTALMVKQGYSDCRML